MKKQERILEARKLVANSTEKLAQYIDRRIEDTKFSRVIKIAIDELIDDLHGDALVDQDHEKVELIKICLKEIKEELARKVVYNSISMTDKMNEISNFKVMIEDYTNYNSDDDAETLAYIDTLDVELFNCATGHDYIIPAVIFDTELEMNNFTQLMKDKFDLQNEKLIAFEGMILRIFTNGK